MSCGTQGIRLVPVDTSRLAARSFIAFCPEIPGANGQGKTKEEAIESLSQAVALILQDRREDWLRGVPPDAVLDKVAVK